MMMWTMTCAAAWMYLLQEHHTHCLLKLVSLLEEKGHPKVVLSLSLSLSRSLYLSLSLSLSLSVEWSYV